MNIDASDASVPEYNLNDFITENEGEEDDLAETIAGEQLAKIQERKTGFNNFDTDSNNVLDQLRTPLSGTDLIANIKNARFYQQTERGLIQLVQTYLSTDTLLSNIENMQNAMNMFHIALYDLNLKVPGTDYNRADYQAIIRSIEASVKLLFTRTHGAYRERRLQDINRAEVITGKLGPGEKKQQAVKKAFGLPFKRGD